MLQRPRRNRKSPAIRAMVEETSLRLNDFIFPLFLIEGSNKKISINSMPGIYRYTLDLLLIEIEECMQLGIYSFCLFPSISDHLKDKFATESTNENGLYLNAIKIIKNRFPECCLMTDVAMDPYSSDGHDGLVIDGKIDNDKTLEILGKMALSQAIAGADILGPSDMMDGRIGYIRNILEDNKFVDTLIMSYSAKYASAFYGPFRDALDSAPKFGDKKTYQMNPANAKEAITEANLDISEGADIIMVKPALAYLDIIQSLSTQTQHPVAAYNVSGEYAMLKAAESNGWIDGDRAMVEVLLSIKRAGAKIILTYFAKEYAALIK